MRKLILAENFNQYRHSPYYPESRFIEVKEDIYGYANTILTKIGTWYKKWDRDILAQIEFYCKTHDIVIEEEHIDR